MEPVAPFRGTPSGSGKRCALLMDSDVHGPASWDSALAAVRGEGHLVSACIFIAAGTGYTDDSDWGKRLASLGIDAKVVPARDASIELCAEAMRLVTECQVNNIALAVKEGDFDYLAGKLRECGSATGSKFSIMEIGQPA
mmetsp:Transcript_43367/g.120006  ORF Transcript_43367/g.120006 Transcript_43367/m.120006 type:complete len:140 (-) Transcript_43367:166-585(-)